jgi:uroporphyrinogen decarboxylase
MRQAGRYLPEYRALKEKHGFLTMVRTPELAAEVTLQPLRRFPLDAAILFSDILVVPEALGQPYRFREEGGIAMDFPLNSPERMRSLRPEAVAEKLDYQAQALRELRRELGAKTALLGFAGAPWTLAAYMVEGGAPAEPAAIYTLAETEPVLFGELMEIITDAVTASLRLQIAAGADAVQIFDSWGARCPDAYYQDWSLRWVTDIISALPAKTPVILFAKGMADFGEDLAGTGARVLSLDTSVDLASFRAEHCGVATQGNLDPLLLEGDPAVVCTATQALLQSLEGPGHIVNLGHGLTPAARVESVAALVETVVGAGPTVPA